MDRLILIACQRGDWKEAGPTSSDASRVMPCAEAKRLCSHIYSLDNESCTFPPLLLMVIKKKGVWVGMVPLFSVTFLLGWSYRQPLALDEWAKGSCEIPEGGHPYHNHLLHVFCTSSPGSVCFYFHLLLFLSFNNNRTTHMFSLFYKKYVLYIPFCNPYKAL